MVAGISGTGAASGAAVGDDDEKEGKLMLLHAPNMSVSTKAVPRLAAVRTPPETTMFIPNKSEGGPVRRQPSAKNPP
jgi:hypothetical protein